MVSRGRFIGEAFPVAEQLFVDALYSLAAFSASENGVLAYQKGSAALGIRSVWYDRAGKEVGVAMNEPLLARGGRLSPDETRLAAAVLDLAAGKSDIWTVDLKRGVRSRLTFDPAAESGPVWSPDSSRIAFSSERKGRPLLAKSASGVGSEETLFQSDDVKNPTDWSRDGRFLIFNRNLRKTKTDIWVLPFSGDRKPFPFLESEFIERNAHFSPDGRWVSYVSDETGRLEIYVRPFPPGGGKWQISTTGGQLPQWGTDGKELFYISPDRQLMAVDVKLGSEFQAGAPKALFPLSAAVGYEVSASSRRFLLGVAPEEPAPPITLVLNWTAELRKK